MDKKIDLEEQYDKICHEKRQTVDFTEQKKCMAVSEKHIGEMEILIAKIYEVAALATWRL